MHISAYLIIYQSRALLSDMLRTEPKALRFAGKPVTLWALSITTSPAFLFIIILLLMGNNEIHLHVSGKEKNKIQQYIKKTIMVSNSQCFQNSIKSKKRNKRV